jgi:phosphohistidine phosphatase
MHRLHLLRHAKARRDDAGEDRERRLSRSGRDDARMIGESLPAALGAIDLVLCSSALRTRETAELALAGLAPRPSILFEDGLYLAGPAALLKRLIVLEESDGAVLVVGHTFGHWPRANSRPPPAPALPSTRRGRRSAARATSWSITSRQNRCATKISPRAANGIAARALSAPA